MSEMPCTSGVCLCRGIHMSVGATQVTGRRDPTSHHHCVLSQGSPASPCFKCRHKPSAFWLPLMTLIRSSPMSLGTAISHPSQSVPVASCLPKAVYCPWLCITESCTTVRPSCRNILQAPLYASAPSVCRTTKLPNLFPQERED